MCTVPGDKGRKGGIFCDVYTGLTGSRIAYGGCYDRNDDPEEYCLTYPEDNWNFCQKDLSV